MPENKYLSAARGLAENCSYESEHSNHVAYLSMQLFRQLNILHNLDPKYGDLLECAAILHDTGYSVAAFKHHKHSYKIIKNSELTGLSDYDKIIIALIARYHRKPMDSEPADKSYYKLKKGDREKVLMLASLIRIADGLDYSHRCAVKKIFCEVNARAVRIDCLPAKSFTCEIKQALKKADLFKFVFDKKVIF